MKGYDLTRAWYNYKFANPDRVRHIHSDMYFYLVDKWNRLGQTEKFGLPTEMTMQALSIGSYNTYKKCLQDLIDFGFVKMITESKNQYQSKIIALSKIDKATDEALDKATAKATDEPTDTINKQRTKNKEQEEREKLFVGEVVKYLNEKANRDFKDTTKNTRSCILARCKEGYTLDQIKSVIDLKTKSWIGDEKMEKFLRPETLFGSKFESYVNEVPSVRTKSNELFSEQPKSYSQW